MTATPDEGTGQGVSAVLSGERVQVAAQWMVSGRVRLRRLVVSETRTVEIVVRREELVVETVDVAGVGPDGLTWVGTAVNGPPVSEPDGQPVMVLPLREEVPHIAMTTRVYEQATLHRRRQTTAVPVTTPVRHEQAVVDTCGLPSDR